MVTFMRKLFEKIADYSKFYHEKFVKRTCIGAIPGPSRSQIREQMSGPDLHVFTLKFLVLKKLVFPP
jgi:hypothetical protein